MFNIQGIDDIVLPRWVKGSQFYYTNIRSEVWAAKIDGNLLYIGRSVDDWEKNILSKEDVYQAVREYRNGKQKIKRDSFAGYIVDKGEINWFMSVIHVYLDALMKGHGVEDNK